MYVVLCVGHRYIERVFAAVQRPRGSPARIIYTVVTTSDAVLHTDASPAGQGWLERFSHGSRELN
jgi:hypothetical protein